MLKNDLGVIGLISWLISVVVGFIILAIKLAILCGIVYVAWHFISKFW